jgi:hypothetical protein
MGEDQRRPARGGVVEFGDVLQSVIFQHKHLCRSKSNKLKNYQLARAAMRFFAQHNHSRGVTAPHVLFQRIGKNGTNSFIKS